MKDDNKTREQLIEELEILRRGIACPERSAPHKLSVNTFSSNEEYYQLLSENAYDVIWLWDLSLNRYLYVSPSVEKLRKFTVEETMSQSLKDALLPESMGLFTDELPRRVKALESGDETARFKSYDMEQKCKDGTLVSTEVMTTFLTDPLGHVQD